MKTNDSSHYSPLNPIWDLPYDPKGGSGILKAKIWVWDGAFSLDTYIPYCWSDTVNGVEVDIEKPNIDFASALEEDIYNAMKQEIDFDTINYITK